MPAARPWRRPVAGLAGLWPGGGGGAVPDRGPNRTRWIGHRRRLRGGLAAAPGPHRPGGAPGVRSGLDPAAELPGPAAALPGRLWGHSPRHRRLAPPSVRSSRI